ncbi:MAG: hypothetical protein QOF65_2054 [Thermoleophilaceae bacterium]|nr:hypothetical protein [Thermoleophilaceae bacterium]
MNTTNPPMACPGCGAVLPEIEGPTHDYIGASAACWARYGELLVREFGELRNPEIHRLSVDTYAVQHPGIPERRAIQSVAVHLMGLSLVLERGWPPHRATAHLGRLVQRARPDWLEPPRPNGTLTVEHPLTDTAQNHADRVREWAENVWQAWSPHHARVNAWLDSYL